PARPRGDDEGLPLARAVPSPAAANTAKNNEMNRWGCAGNESAARRASKLAAELIRGRHRRTASHLRGTRPAPPSALSNQCPPNPPIKPQRWGSADNTIPETMVSSTNKQATFRTFVPADAGSQIRQSVTRTLERKRWPGATRID